MFTGKNLFYILAFGLISPAVSLWVGLLACVFIPGGILLILDGKITWDFTPILSGLLCLYKFGILSGLCSGMYATWRVRRGYPIKAYAYYALSLAGIFVMGLLATRGLLADPNLATYLYIMIPAVLLNAFVALRIMRKQLIRVSATPVSVEA